ncbi:hypothetical protein F2Q69_00040823 [Brassica cretica]|uniref:Uncharacterized protein n=1 Tax=Brassica cretica TaxID=69181 RepID=A0A8S9NJG6_BRACR|nr:hypothetical protein F2Q69_00040823 [Brassica cretica]
MDTYVNEGQAVNIEFRSEAWPGCEEFSKYWEVDESSSALEEPAILTGGKKRERNSWFRIEREEKFVGGNAYKLTTLAGTIGTVPGPWENAPQLVLTNDTAKTFLVKFHKVHGDTTSTSRLEKLESFPVSSSRISSLLSVDKVRRCYSPKKLKENKAVAEINQLRGLTVLKNNIEVDDTSRLCSRNWCRDYR